MQGENIAPTRRRTVRSLPERLIRRYGGILGITTLICWGAYTLYINSSIILKITWSNIVHPVVVDIMVVVLFCLGFITVFCLVLSSWINPGYFPYKNNSNQIQSFTQTEETSKNQLRYCKHCKCSKPDRAYHVHSVGSCVLRLSHFCPVIGTPLALRNQKPFCLFLIYVITLCIIMVFLNGYLIIQVYSASDLYDTPPEMLRSVWWLGGDVYVHFSPHEETFEIDNNHPTTLIIAHRKWCMLEYASQITICIITPILLSLFIVPVQYKNVVHNVTQQEEERIVMEEIGIDDKGKVVWSTSKYDLGMRSNLMQVFGKQSWQWLLPITPTEMNNPLAGIEWEVSKRWLTVTFPTAQSS